MLESYAPCPLFAPAPSRPQLWHDSGPLDPPPGWDGCAHYTLSTYYCFR